MMNAWYVHLFDEFVPDALFTMTGMIEVCSDLIQPEYLS